MNQWIDVIAHHLPRRGEHKFSASAWRRTTNIVLTTVVEIMGKHIASLFSASSEMNISAEGSQLLGYKPPKY